MSDIGRDFWEGPVALSASAQKIYDAAAITSPYDKNPLDLTIFVSCYNEEKYIVATLEAVIDAMRVVNKSYEIIVIDDASKDRSEERIRRFIDAHPEAIIVMRANRRNKGMAANYVDAAFIGRGQYFCLVRGDNTESMETISDMLKSLGEGDILVPHDISSVKEARPPAQQFYTALFNFITRQRIEEYNGLAVHLRHNVLRWHPDISGYGFQACLLSRLLDLGFTFKQVPCRTAAPRGDIPFSWTKTFSVLHAVMNIVLGRMSRRVYGK